MSAENVLSAWSRLLIESLADAGLERIIVSPGSRSTPFVWAALECARIHCEHVIDERCAAFHAVGWAKMTGKPAGVLCTSGSAAANYFPAVVEASLSHTPLLVLTADRPFELMDCGASQTMDQVKLYGDYVRHFVDVGMPDESTASLQALRRVAAQSIALAMGDRPGPVHLNLRARKPLEPREPTSTAARELRDRVDRVLQNPPPTAARPRRVPDPAAIADVAAHCVRAHRGIIVCGPMYPAQRPDPALVARVVKATGFPIFAEASSGLRFDSPVSDPFIADAFGALLTCDSFRRRAAPEVVLQLGAAAICASWETLLQAHPPAARFVFAEHGWPDPTSTARAIVYGDVNASLTALCDALDPAATNRTGTYAADLREANQLAWKVVEDELDARGFTEGAAVRVVIDHLPKGSLLCLGNSLPVREADTFSRARAGGVTVWSQRGASGIDGLISGAAGAAKAFRGPCTLLIGDVSFLHDLGGLQLARHRDEPFVIVVLNNDGGRIFEQLPIAARTDLQAGALEFWTTPHGLGFEHAARLFHLPYAPIVSANDLVDALRSAYATSGCSVIEIRLEPGSARDDENRLTKRLQALMARRQDPK